MRHRKTVGLAVVTILALGLILNVTGVAPIPGGPVGTSSLPPDGDFQTVFSPAGIRETIYQTLYLTSQWPVPATLVSVTPERVAASTVVSILGSARGDWSTGLALGAVSDPGPGWRSPDPIAGATIPSGPNSNPLFVLVGLHPTTPGDAAVGWFAVDYSIGPFRFRSVDGSGMLICARQGTATMHPQLCSSSP